MAALLVTLENAPEAYAALRLSYTYGSRKFWETTADIVTLLSWGEVVVIEAGFRTDLSSVPRAFWNICPPFGDFLFGAIIHDWLYVHNRQRLTTRRQADREMLLWSQVLNPRRPLDNHTRYAAVRLFGAPWWRHDHPWV